MYVASLSLQDASSGSHMSSLSSGSRGSNQIAELDLENDDMYNEIGKKEKAQRELKRRK